MTALKAGGYQPGFRRRWSWLNSPVYSRATKAATAPATGLAVSLFCF